MKIKITTARIALRILLALSALPLTLAGCGGGGDGGGGAAVSTTGGTPTPTMTYMISGNLVGLAAGNSIVLQNNGGDNLTVSANGAFTFTTPVASTATYSVTVLSQPANGQLCAVTSGGSGTVSNANVTTVTVGCSSTVSGYLVGLAAGQSVVLQNNGGDNLTVNANGAFTFSTPLQAPSTYNVTVLTQPANGQICAIAKNSSTSGSSGIGTVSSAFINTVRVNCPSIFTFAGSGVAGNGNATGEDAVFQNPSGIARDASGNLYVIDVGDNHVRKITPAGAVTTLAGSGRAGYTDAAGAAAQFNFMQSGNVDFAGIAVDGSGNVYVADNGNHVIRKISPAGLVSTLAGSGSAGYADATGGMAQFNAPHGVAVDGAGNVYVADTGNSVIRKITPGGVVTTLAGSVYGFLDATGLAARFAAPESIAVDTSGNVYVADTGNSVIRKITPGGVVSSLAGSTMGYLDGTGSAAKFNTPEGVAVDASGNVYVSDFANDVVRMITPAGVVSTLVGAGVGFSDGPATKGKFYWPQGLAVDAAGNVYLADRSSHRIRKISPQPYSYTVGGHIVGLLSGNSLVLKNNGGDTLTVGSNGRFTFATPLTDISGAASYNVTVATQPAGQTCAVVNGTGGFTSGNVLTVGVNCALVSTFAGSGVAGYTNASGTAAQFKNPSGVAFDTAGNLYVVDNDNQAIRKISPSGVVSTLAGAGVAGYADGTGTAAKFNFFGPTGLAVDAAGNVYVGDTSNHVIRKITSGGVVTTLAGGYPTTSMIGFADGTGTAALFYYPRGVALDGLGNLYVADDANNSIRKVTTSGGVVTTLAGGQDFINTGYVNATGTAARFTHPNGVAVDSAGNVYVADTGNATIRKITPAGVVTTLAGAGISAGSLLASGYRDSTGTGAVFFGPTAIAVDATGNVYVTDGNVARMINPTGTVVTLAGPAPLSTPGYLDGNGASALFNFGCSSGSGAGIALTAGNVYMGDTCNHSIRKIVP